MKQTTNYKLNKVDVSVDGESYFSFETCLNKNWDTVDTKIKKNADDIGTVSTYAQAVNTKTNTNTSSINTLSSTVSGLNTTVSGLNSTVSGLSSTVSALSGKLANNCKIVTGSYTGTGVSGGTTKYLDFGGKLKPQMVIIYRDSDGNVYDNPAVFLKPLQKYAPMQVSGSNVKPTGICSWPNNEVRWFGGTSSPADSLDSDGVTYYYIAIGEAVS